MDQDNIIGFHHFAIKAQDFDATVQFYGALGFETVHYWALPDFQLERCCMMRHRHFGRSYIEICDNKANFPTQGRKKLPGEDYVENAIMHICFTVKDARLAYHTAIQNGATALSEVTTLELPNADKSTTVTNALVYSPNGEVIEFLEQVAF